MHNCRDIEKIWGYTFRIKQGTEQTEVTEQHTKNLSEGAPSSNYFWMLVAALSDLKGTEQAQIHKKKNLVSPSKAKKNHTNKNPKQQ